MNLIGRVFFLSLCVFTALALPRMNNVGNEEKNLVQYAIVDPSASDNNSQDACTFAYSDTVNEINIATIKKTQDCYQKAATKLADFNGRILNVTVQEGIGYSQDLQDTLANCSAHYSNVDIMNCYITNFDKNLDNLYNLSKESEIAVGGVLEYEWQIKTVTKVCVDQVFVESRVNMTDASYKLQACLDNSVIPNLNFTMPDRHSNSP